MNACRFHSLIGSKTRTVKIVLHVSRKQSNLLSYRTFASRPAVDATYDLILDGIFGFSFSGSIRPPFDTVIETLRACRTPIISIDIPSGWHVENGNDQGIGLDPKMLISLTAPKLCAKSFTGSDKIHFVGGRFVPRYDYSSSSLAGEIRFEEYTLTFPCALTEFWQRSSSSNCLYTRVPSNAFRCRFLTSYIRLPRVLGNH